MLLQALRFLKHWLHWTFFTTLHLWSSRVTMTLLHQRQQRWMSTIKEPQEWKINDVAATKKEIKSAEVCKESTSSDDKDNDAAVTTQACFTEVTDMLDEAMRFSQSQASLWEWLWSQCQYHTQKMCMKLTEVMIKVQLLIGVVIWVSKQKQHNEIATVRQLMLVSCKREVERKWKKEEKYILMLNSIVSTTSALSLNELNQNKQWKFTHTSMTQQQKFTLVSTTWWWPCNTSALWRHQRTCTQEKRQLSEWIQM